MHGCAPKLTPIYAQQHQIQLEWIPFVQELQSVVTTWPNKAVPFLLYPVAHLSPLLPQLLLAVRRAHLIFYLPRLPRYSVFTSLKLERRPHSTEPSRIQEKINENNMSDTRDNQCYELTNHEPRTSAVQIQDRSPDAFCYPAFSCSQGTRCWEWSLRCKPMPLKSQWVDEMKLLS